MFDYVLNRILIVNYVDLFSIYFFYLQDLGIFVTRFGNFVAECYINAKFLLKITIKKILVFYFIFF